ncbi:MAG: hypothetical protein KDG49_18165, partial [Geminicoccaceae bacterium]|nr:hypothetical protein [Geminicoccaceae bacterium]
SGGDGSWHGQAWRGGSASGGDGSWHATGAEGTKVQGSYAHATSVDVAYPHAYRGPYYATYHPPVTVDHYSSSCDNCGGWSGGAVAAAGALGLAAGAAIDASAAKADTAAATSSAYAAGVSAGEAAAPASAVTSPAQPTKTAAAPSGTVYTELPSNCAYKVVKGSNYFDCGDMWLTAAYGANGLHYTVVPAP